MQTILRRRLRFRHLLLIEALADHGTMHRAAEVLGMTQSTASKMLGDLEAILGASLFVREPRGMSPTPLGSYALSMARTQLSRLDRFAEEFVARRDGGYGTLTVGAIMGAAPDLLARSIAQLKKERPQLVVRLLGETSDQILEMLEAGKIDLAIGRFSQAHHHELFAFEPLAEEKLVLIGRPGHELTTGFDGDLRVLSDWPWIVQGTATPARRALEAAFVENECPFPENMIECVSIFAMLSLVQESSAVALLPQSVVRAHLTAGLLVQLPLAVNIEVSGFGLVTRKGESLSSPTEEFLSILRAEAGSGHLD